jgi:uncharacterized Fe-S cluster-containing radical SAM superfamily protein
MSPSNRMDRKIALVGDPVYIDTDKFSHVLRERAMDSENRRILMTHFENSEQGKDLTLPPNCDGFGRIHHFRRDSGGKGWPPNPLPIDPATNALGLSKVDSMQAQVFQIAICSWRCWYCFVDFSLLSADPRHSEFKTVDELLESYLSEQIRAPIIDLSGGQPDLVPEWVLWFTDSLRKRGLDKKVYVWTDDNLSNDYLWRYLSAEQLHRLSSSQNYGRVGCFKGFDEHSFSFNTHAAPEMFGMQFRLMKRLVDARFDVYGYVTFTSDSDKHLSAQMRDFVDRLQSEIHPLFPLRTVPLRIFEFTPTAPRTGAAQRQALKIQDQAAQAWSEELRGRFSSQELARHIGANKLRVQ